MRETDRAIVFKSDFHENRCRKKTKLPPPQLIFTAEEPLPSRIIPINCDCDLNAIDRALMVNTVITTWKGRVRYVKTRLKSGELSARGGFSFQLTNTYRYNMENCPFVRYLDTRVFFMPRE